MSSRGSITLIDATATLLLLSASLVVALHCSKLVFGDNSLLPYQIKKCAAQKVGESYLLGIIERTGHLALIENPYAFKNLLSNILERDPPPMGVKLVLKVNEVVVCEWGDLQGSEILATTSMAFSTDRGLVEMTCYVGEAAIES